MFSAFPFSSGPRLIRVEEPEIEPITVAEAKAWLKVDASDDDTMIGSLISAARAQFEEITGRTLISTTYRAEWDSLPRAGTFIGAPIGYTLELPRTPLAEEGAVTWIKYLDENGAENTFSSSLYGVESSRDPNRFGRVFLKKGAEWPELGNFPGALRCEFVAGYGADEFSVPEDIKRLIKIMVKADYDPAGADRERVLSMVESYRIREIA